MADTLSTNLDLTIMEIGAHENDWGDVNSANLVILDAAIGDTEAIATTGGNTNLTVAQQQSRILNVTGVLVSNATITLQAAKGGSWLVRNATTGAYTLTVKYAASTGVAVPQGYNTEVFGTTTEVYRAGLVVGTDVQAYDAELAALAGLTSAADRLPYFTGSGAAALATFTAFGRSLVDDAAAVNARTTLGLVIGTDVQAQDAELAAIAGLTSAADKLPYFTGSGTAGVADFTAAGRALVDDADATAQRTTLGLAIGVDVQAYDAELAALAGLTSAADRVPYFTGSGTAALATVTAAGMAILDDANASAQRTTLGLVIGTDVQAYDAELAAIAGLTSAADKVPYFTGSGTAALATFTAAGAALMDDATATAQRVTLGLVIGTDVQAYDADLAALAGVTSAADRVPYFTGSGTATVATFTAFARTLVDDADAAAARATLGAVIGTNVQAWDADLDAIAALAKTDSNFIVGDGAAWVAESGATARASLGLTIGTNVQAYDADLSAIAALTSAANKVPYSTGAQAWALAGLSAYGRTLIDDADAGEARTTLGLVIGASVQEYSPVLDAISTLTAIADRLPYFDGADTATTTVFTAAGRALVDDADATAQRVTLGLVIGTNVQAFDADLTAIAALASTGFPAHTGAGTWSERSVAVGTGLAVSNPAGIAGNPTVSLGTYAALLGQLGMYFDLGTIADDAAVSINVGVTAGLIGFLIPTLGTQARVIFSSRPAATPAIAEIIDTGTVTYTATLLAGTTGADASLNLGCDASGNIYVENRTGANFTAVMFIFKR